MAKEWKNWGKKSGGGGSAFYFVGFIGALIYFWQQAPTFWDGLIGFFKACFWPAYMVYELFKYLRV
jgi:hypothetical protein